MSDVSRETLTCGELARVAYEAYGVSGGWKTFDGRPMPRWENLKQPTRDRWMAAALAVHDVSRETSREE